MFFFFNSWQPKIVSHYVSLTETVNTREVLDYHVLSKECHKCVIKRSQCQSDEEFENWQLEHLAAGDCDINFTGSSPEWKLRVLQFYGTGLLNITIPDTNGW